MGDYFSKFFDTSDFPARWQCGNWSEFLGWLHIASDVATFAAYFTIPAVLIYFAWHRRDFPFSKLFWLFASFIFACGTVHLIEAIIFWQPIYRVSGLMKFVTAVVSWATVIALIRYAPLAMKLPSIAAANERLRVEIEQRRRTERELQEANDRHNAILAGTRSIVWTTDPDGGFSSPQISWERYTGQAWGEHKGHGWADAIHQDDLPKLRRRWQEALESGEKYQTTARLWHQDSQSYRTFVTESVPVRNLDGSIREWVGTVSDVEELYQAETSLGIMQSELAKQKHELELIYEAAPVGMSLVDREHRFLRVNETLARMNGFSREAHIGRKAEEMFVNLAEAIEPLYDQVFQTGKAVTDIEIVGKTNAITPERTWLVSYYPLFSDIDNLASNRSSSSLANPSLESAENENGQTVFAVSAIVQDITERKEQELRLRQSEQRALAANKSKSEFLANMSHEIRTPMAAILGYADVLLGHLKDPDNRNCVSIMKRNGEHLLSVINDILDLSRIEAGKLDVELEQVPLPQLVADIESLMQVRAEEKKVKFKVEFKGKVPRNIETDATRLRQVLINLIGNAIKFTDEGNVRLQVRFIKGADPAAIEFAIVDTGIGMSEEQIQRLFRPFSQGDSSVTRQYGGSGLGLAISQRLVEMMNGEMDLRSELGVGSTFFVRLPIAAVDEIELVKPNLVVRSPAPEEPLAALPRLSCRVLVVDDRRDVRHISQHFLEKAGATVATAEDGGQGIDAAIKARDSGEPFDLVVMDMQMPNVDGLQAVSALRCEGIEWPIIALTADAMKGDRDRCLNGGCDDYLAKPIDHAKLIHMVARYTQQLSLNQLRKWREKRARRLRQEVDDSGMR